MMAEYNNIEVEEIYINDGGYQVQNLIAAVSY